MLSDLLRRARPAGFMDSHLRVVVKDDDIDAII